MVFRPASAAAVALGSNTLPGRARLAQRAILEDAVAESDDDQVASGAAEPLLSSGERTAAK